MNRAENDLFRRAIVEALSQNNREELAECTDPVVASKKHYRKMSAILGFGVRRPVVWTRTRKMWVAAIIAAALLLTGCAVANYKAIGEFIINIYEDIIKMPDLGREDQTLNSDFEIYELTYVPEGYSLIETFVGENICCYKWSSESEKKELNFSQRERGSSIYSFDEVAELIDIGNNQISIHHTGDSVCYIWNTEQYVFTLYSNCVLEMKELQKIIEGVSLVASNK